MMGNDLLKRLLEIWSKPESECELNAGASAEEIENVQRELGRLLPGDFIEVYKVTNGASLVQGNLNLYPLLEEDLSVHKASQFLRDAEWPIPDELIIFGDNGGGNSFGLWIPSAGSHKSLVVEIGEIFEPGCMAIVGASFFGFLLGRTAYYLGLIEVPTKLLQILDVPRNLIKPNPSDEDFESIIRWADPKLPKLPISAYDARLDAEKVSEIAKSFQ